MNIGKNFTLFIHYSSCATKEKEKNMHDTVRAFQIIVWKAFRRRKKNFQKKNFLLKIYIALIIHKLLKFGCEFASAHDINYVEDPPHSKNQF